MTSKEFANMRGRDFAKSLLICRFIFFCLYIKGVCKLVQINQVKLYILLTSKLFLFFSH